MRGNQSLRRAAARPRSAADIAIQKAKRAANVAKAQETLARLLRAMKVMGVPMVGWTTEHQFFGRKDTHPWRFDLAHADLLIAVEVDGGVWSGKPCPLCGQRPGGRHSHGAMEKERLKMNEAAAFGWAVLRFSTTSIEREAVACAELVVLAWSQRVVAKGKP